MAGSAYFMSYDRNLRRILMLEWLRGEELRRCLTKNPLPGFGPRPAGEQQPYWLQLRDSIDTRK